MGPAAVQRPAAAPARQLLHAAALLVPVQPAAGGAPAAACTASWEAEGQLLLQVCPACLMHGAVMSALQSTACTVSWEQEGMLLPQLSCASMLSLQFVLLFLM